ncbi:hypothetical protein [Pedobacter jeongneungensis]|uniref:hypothetical protein n=1 Tax=Pedobacter jeongneungensis TaxID=947309 RepID=UPI0013B35C0A|nr:hypothetical protein [Pedobacter jeongneungensis]
MVLFIGKSYAGWYECYNFKGNIANNPITLSIQIRESYFGEKEKKNYNLVGTYKYDRYNSPIRLEGKIDLKNNQVVLYELVNEKQTAVFEFKFSQNAINGSWLNKSTSNRRPLHLQVVSKITDLNLASQFSNVDVLQYQSLKDFYLIGSYSKTKGIDQAQMKLLKIMSKKDNSLYQTIDLSNVSYQTGNLMTIIFDNVLVVDFDKNNLGLSRQLGKNQDPLNIFYNVRTRKFEIDQNNK